MCSPRQYVPRAGQTTLLTASLPQRMLCSIRRHSSRRALLIALSLLTAYVAHSGDRQTLGGIFAANVPDVAPTPSLTVLTGVLSGLEPFSNSVSPVCRLIKNNSVVISLSRLLHTLPLNFVLACQLAVTSHGCTRSASEQLWLHVSGSAGGEELVVCRCKHRLACLRETTVPAAISHTASAATASLDPPM